MRVSLRRELVVAGCAASAGIHAALAPAHLHQGTATAAGFVVAAVTLTAAAVAVARGIRGAAGASALLLTGLLVAYTAEGEPDVVGLATKAIEAGALLLAVETRGEPPVRVTLAGAAVVALAAATGALLFSGSHAH